MKNFVIVASVSRGNGFCKMYLDQTEQWFLMITQTLPDVRMQYHGITEILRADKEPHHTSTAIGHWTASCCILELIRNGVTLCAKIFLLPLRNVHGRKLIFISNIVDQIPMIGEMIQQLLFQDGTDGQRVVATTACWIEGEQKEEEGDGALFTLLKTSAIETMPGLYSKCTFDLPLFCPLPQ